MNRRNDPERLQVMACRKIRKMLRDAAVKWTQRMDLATVTSWNIWLQDIISFDKECALVRRNLATLPLSPLADIVLYAIQEFAKYISPYYKKNCRPPVMRIMDRQVHNICENMFKAVLLPCICRLDIGFTKSYFVQELLLRLLYVIPNIESLTMPSEYGRNYLHLVQNIPILTLLQEFHFHAGCTTEIIIELSKYCLQMKIISVQDSIDVNDECVEHLLKFRQLRNLNVKNTSLSNSSYTALLSGVSQIQDIIWLDPIDAVLRNITVCLPSVTEFDGRFSDAALLVQKCQNIKKLRLHSCTWDISDLGELKNVTTLSFFWCICNLIEFSDLMKRLGTTLTKLEMNRADNLKMDDLINYCSVLNSLTIINCRVICTETTFDSELPHFKNLEELRLNDNGVQFDFTSVLHLYVNLKVLSIVIMQEVTDTFITQIVTAGGFRNVTEFVIEGCGRLSMHSAWLLLQNCHNLTKLGKMDSWRGVTKDELVALLNYVRHNNLSLTVCR